MTALPDAPWRSRPGMDRLLAALDAKGGATRYVGGCVRDALPFRSWALRSDSLTAGLLTVLLPQSDVEALWTAIEADPTTEVTVDLNAREVRYAGTTVPFEIDDYTRWRLLEGLDDVGLTERHLDDIEAFEAQRPSWKPKAQPAVP